MKKKRLIKILLGCLIGLIIISGGILFFKKSPSQVVEVKESRLAMQKVREENLVTTGYTIDNPNVVLDPYNVSPLTALIMFETDVEVEPTIVVEGKDKNTTLEYQFSKNKQHYLYVYGLYPDKDNKVTIQYNINGQNVIKEIRIRTAKLPDDLVLPSSIKANREKLDNDFYFFSPSAKGYTCAYDVNGDVRWYLSMTTVWDIEKLDNGHLLLGTDRLINSPYYVTGFYEIDMLGKIYNEYAIKGGYHHDYFELENGNFLVASDDFNNEYGTVEDYIVEIDRYTGKEVKHFDLKEILKMNDGKSENWTEYDWFHNNSVWYDKNTNSITLSGRHQDAVINIDYETGKLNWIIGDSTNWSEEYQKYFFKPVGDNFEWQWSQHAAMITPEGYVFVLDNGNNKSKIKDEYVSASNSYTRGVMYEIDTTNMTIKQVWEYGKKRGSSFYSPYISDVDYLDNNHYIVHSGGIVYVNGKVSNYPAGLTNGDTKLKSTTVELLNNEVIFEITLPTNNYRVEKMNIYENSRYQKGNGKYLGTLGETKVDSKKLEFLKSNKEDEEYKSKEIRLTKEVDRLILNGKFKKEDKVSVILRKGFISRYYDVKVSKKPYTAMCIDVFSEEETTEGINVYKYINQEELKGTYDIYLKINDKVYNLNKKVEF